MHNYVLSILSQGLERFPRKLRWVGRPPAAEIVISRVPIAVANAHRKEESKWKCHHRPAPQKNKKVE